MTRILKAETVRDGYAKVTLLTLEDDQGRQHRREVVSFGHAACVLPYDPTRKVALIVRVPRAPLLLAGIETPLIEAPAGMIEPGEAPEETARREAMEETGVGLDILEAIGACWSSPGVVAEFTHLFLAPYTSRDRVGKGGGVDSEHEGVRPEEVELSRLGLLQTSGGLADLKTLTLVLALRLKRPDLF
ncbi:MAG TPA: NUDIX domain-containing protein [Caulobacteraceae bacterium]|nr:NUDIX domain-containing protein [Caulobacteraceae bacterium]